VETFPGLGREKSAKKASEQLNQSHNAVGRISWLGNDEEMLEKGKRVDGFLPLGNWRYNTQHPYYFGADLHAISVPPGDPVECESRWTVAGSASERSINSFQDVRSYSSRLLPISVVRLGACAASVLRAR
jgi:hypothetical protein